MPSNPESLEFFKIKTLFLSPNSSMSSPSPSPSSSSTTTITTSTVKCLAGILRRMLCSRSLPTHPTDHITESSSVTASASSEGLGIKAENKVSPTSVVAKLMGLDSMPGGVIISSNPPGTITRCHSMNSVDYFTKVEESDPEVKGEHIRLKSSLSFRELPTPTFFELENEEFFVMSFENEREMKGKRLKERKCEKGSEEFKQISEDSPRVSLEFSTSNNHGAKLRRNKKKKKKKRKKKKNEVKNVEHECSSEETSPVSVLDFDQFILDHEVPTTDSMESKNSRRKLSADPEKIYEGQSQRRNDNNLMILDDLKTKKVNGKCVGSRQKGCSSKQIYLNMCDQICRVAEAEILESIWPCSGNISNHEDFEDIYADFESQILDQLLHELLVHQLIVLPS